jgi:hypothetical protein
MVQLIEMPSSFHVHVMAAEIQEQATEFATGRRSLVSVMAAAAADRAPSSVAG